MKKPAGVSLRVFVFQARLSAYHRGFKVSTANSTASSSLLRRLFCTLVLALALFQFAENTADPDLWGHVFFGQHLLKTGVLEKTEPFSWTAVGYPWINHEILSEVALAAAHLVAGGSGILFLKIAIGLVTFLIVLRISRTELKEQEKLFAWAFGALAVVEISYGFAARPQIFSALFLCLQFWLLRRVHSGRHAWAIGLPVLFAIWINTHGGALAGVVLMWLATGATSVHLALRNLASRLPRFGNPPNGRLVTALWAATLASTGALLLNPYGIGLIRWLIGSVLWLRPEIEEWNPATLGWDHGAFFALVVLSMAAVALSRKRAALWEIAVCSALMILALRSVRHTPLFSIAALAFIPPHLADAVDRFRPSFARVEMLWSATAIRRGASMLMFVAIPAVIASTALLHKERCWTMEVPRAQYPVSAIKFMQERELHGNLLVFFDWGEMAIWELADCRPSVDGRLDTCYPRNVIAVHWKFYNSEAFDEATLPIGKADVALLPANLAGAFSLAKRSGWQPVYLDDLAVVLVRGAERFPGLGGLTLPVTGNPDAAKGRAAFPNKPAALKRRT